jgi:REP element-mobilizing transposase RayT
MPAAWRWCSPEPATSSTERAFSCQRESGIAGWVLEGVSPRKYTIFTCATILNRSYGREMARKVRIEYAGACYHVINRGNYRSWIFDSEGARKSFLKCLREASEAMGWRLRAWVLMGNHYHLCIQTPEGNLVQGMRWLQSTFANRFNRFRKESGHVFQGRYKAILLDEDAAGAVCHYIHLNPVRVGFEGFPQGGLG